jgi:hypothetical protein
MLLWLRSRARHARVTQSLLEERPERMPGAGLMLLLALFVGGCGILSAVVVLLPYVV